MAAKLPNIRHCFSFGCGLPPVDQADQPRVSNPTAAPPSTLKSPSFELVRPIVSPHQHIRRGVKWARNKTHKSNKTHTVNSNDTSKVNSFQNNKKLVVLLWQHLEPAEKRSFRASCSAVRNVANKLQTKIRLTESARHPVSMVQISRRFPNTTHLSIVAGMPEAILTSALQMRSLCAHLLALEIHTTSFLGTSTLCNLPNQTPNLLHLSISAKAGSISPEFLTACTRFPKLRSLHLGGCQALSTPNWLPLADMPLLSSLHLEGIKELSFHTLTVLLESIDSLTSLTLTSCAFDPQPSYIISSSPTIVSMSPLSSLTSLTIASCTGVPASALNTLSTLPRLNTLVLPASLPPNTSPPLPATLQTLDLSDNPLPAPLLSSISHMGPLKALTLSSPTLTIPPSTLLPSTLCIHHLDLTHCALPDQTLNTLFHLSHLTHLAFTLHSPNLPTSISQLTNLQTLSCNLTLDRTLVPLLIPLPHLRSLTVKSILLWPNSGVLAPLSHLCATSCHQFADHDWLDISEATRSLQSIELQSCTHITDAGLANIAVHLPRLETLKLTGLFRVSATGCLSLLQHKSLREVQLGLPRMSQLQLFGLERQLADAGIVSQCGVGEDC